ncbi:MAG TPA: CapA family protein [Terrimicrobiaceae bacterium]|mgnify:CR=1 FL=1|nr:CapA family protein [Terrimicrobiaceae bacterium]
MRTGAGCRMKREMTLLAAGQALIRSDLRGVRHPGFLKLLGRIRSADLSFTNFEGAVLGNPHCWPTKDDRFCGAVPAGTLQAVAAMGFSALALANNHAFDLGPGGILATLEEARGCGVLAAGIGEDFSAAANPAVRDFPFGGAALLAVHCGDRSEARSCRALNAQPSLRIPARPGVNMLEGVPERGEDGGGSFRAEDIRLHRDRISHAAAAGHFVLVYIHHHTLGPTPEIVPPPFRIFCRMCIDAGASAVVGHGTPVLQGVEIYRERPIFFNLANFIFHTQAVEMWSGRHGSHPWESCLASARFLADGRLSSLELHPIVLGRPAELAGTDAAGRRASFPVPAEGTEAERILQRVADLSAQWNTAFQVHESSSGQWSARWSRPADSMPPGCPAGTGSGTPAR